MLLQRHSIVVALVGAACGAFVVVGVPLYGYFVMGALHYNCLESPLYAFALFSFKEEVNKYARIIYHIILYSN